MKKYKIDYGNSELNSLISTLKEKLSDYLLEHDVVSSDWTRENNKPFRCINPDHDDKNPSMTFIKRSDYTLVKCFSCGVSADIFKAATWLDGHPSYGHEWINNNVYALANKYGIECPTYTPTEDDLKKARVLSMLADASDVLIGLSITSKVINGLEHTRKRGIKDSIANELGLGTVDWDEFVKTMKAYGGWEQDFIEAHGVTDRYFGREFLTITLKDQRGVVVGFDRRYMNFDQNTYKEFIKLNKYYPPKYLLPNKSNIFDPDTFLYGLYRAESLARIKRSLDVVEGYMSVISGIQAGVTNMVASCGTNGIKDPQMDMLVKMGYEEVCLIFDNDLAGKKAVKRYVEFFAKRHDLKCRFKFLPFNESDNIELKDQDPDNFFKLYCRDNLSAFEAVQAISSFRVSLDLEKAKGTSGEDLARAQVTYIASETDSIVRGRMIRELSANTGVKEEDIRHAIDDIIHAKSATIAKNLERDIAKIKICTPKALSEVISKHSNALAYLQGGSSQSVTAKAAKAGFFEALDAFDNAKGVTAGYKTGDYVFDTFMGGVQRGLFLCIAGNPNSGKSALAHNLCGGILDNLDVNKDVCILEFSFDDTLSWSWAKYISRKSGLPIVWCANPQKWIYHDPELTAKYKEARDFFCDITGDFLRIFDGSIGMNSRQMNKAIKDARESTGKHIVVLVDSFNKMQHPDGTEGRVGAEQNADYLHELMHNGYTIITTAECVKQSHGKKPSYKDIKDSSKVAYNATLVCMVYNELHEKRELANYWHVVEDSMEQGKKRKAAVLEASFEKNKVSEYKESALYQFMDQMGRFNYLQPSSLRQFMLKQKEDWIKWAGQPIDIQEEFNIEVDI